MKKLLTLILSIFYIGTSTGATLHMHYCKGELVDVELWHKEARPCGKCGSAPGSSCSKDCCKDVHKTVKLDKDQKRSEQAYSFLQAELAVAPLPVYASRPVHSVLQVLAVPVGNAPPPSAKVRPHVFHCIFRI